MNVERQPLVLRPDARRVLFRPFGPTTERGVKIVARVMALSEKEVESQIAKVLQEFEGRHSGLERLFHRRFEQLKDYLLTDAQLSSSRQLLLGAYFTQEYALESAALFNPSIVWDPDQSGVREGARRFILSLRAVGEGHLSSITFRRGLVLADGTIEVEPPGPWALVPSIDDDSPYEKDQLRRMLFERGLLDEFAERLLEHLEDGFTLRQLEAKAQLLTAQARRLARPHPSSADAIVALARRNYEIIYEADTRLDGRIIFPYSPTESRGIEDARFVELVEEDGSRVFVATYTAWDGHLMFPQLLLTEDFLRFRLRSLSGPQALNKGMALFPRRLNGRYAMISRQDNENLFVMYSDNLYFWYDRIQMMQPTHPWEFVQLGNCGSPLETSEGWLVLTHGVGPVRKYSIGAILLDLDDPTRVIGRLREPLLTPNDNEREGYVPNVVYSCGCIIHEDRLIIPYAMADYASTFATVSLRGLLDELKQAGP